MDFVFLRLPQLFNQAMQLSQQETKTVVKLLLFQIILPTNSQQEALKHKHRMLCKWLKQLKILRLMLFQHHKISPHLDQSIVQQVPPQALLPQLHSQPSLLQHLQAFRLLHHSRLLLLQLQHPFQLQQPQQQQLHFQLLHHFQQQQFKQLNKFSQHIRLLNNTLPLLLKIVLDSPIQFSMELNVRAKLGMLRLMVLVLLINWLEVKIFGDLVNSLMTYQLITTNSQLLLPVNILIRFTMVRCVSANLALWELMGCAKRRRSFARQTVFCKTVSVYASLGINF